MWLAYSNTSGSMVASTAPGLCLPSYDTRSRKGTPQSGPGSRWDSDRTLSFGRGGQLARKREALHAEADALSAERDTLLEHLEKEHVNVPPMIMTSAALNDTRLAMFEDFIEDSTSRNVKEIERWHAETVITPIPTVRRQPRILNRRVVWQRQAPAKPEWAKPLARHRAHVS